MKIQKSTPACPMPAYKSMLHSTIMQLFQSAKVQKIQNRGSMKVQKYVTCRHAKQYVACRHAKLHATCQLLKTACHMQAIENCMLQCESVKL